MTKNKTFPLNHSLACASYTIYLAIDTCICEEGRKNRKSNGEKRGQQARKARSIIENQTQDPFQFVSIWLWCSRCFIIPSCYNKHDTWFSLILYCCKRMWGVERGSIL